MFSAVVLFTLVVAAVIIFLFVFTPSSKVRKLVDQIPGPPTVPFFGNALQFKTNGVDFYKQVLQWNSEYGRDTGIFRTWLTYHTLIFLTKAETVEVILKSPKFITKSSDYKFFEPWLNTGLLTSTGDKWHSRRKLLTSSFHFSILEDFLQVMNEQASVLVKKLDAVIGQKKSVEFDIRNYIMLCALDIICDSAMGKHVSAQENSDSEYVHAVNKMTELIMQRIKAPWLWPDALYELLPAGRQHRRLLNILHKFTDDVIHQRRADFDNHLLKVDREQSEGSDGKPVIIYGTRKRLAFLDMLLYSAESANLKHEDIREEVDTFMFEGHDTTGYAVNWALHLIGTNQTVQSRLHQELDLIFDASDRPVTMDDIKKLKYLECVIKEALRLFPSVPIYGRIATEDCNIGGFTMPKGATAVISPIAVHRDPKYYPNPEEFNPDRWSTAASEEERHPFAFIPFSAGQRNCIGQKLAMNEEKVVLSSILRRFRITSLQTRDELLPQSDIILRPANGIKIRLERR